MEERTLYVGGDDSNHGGQEKGEFIVATFSKLHKDSIVGRHPNRRDYTEVQRWLQNPERDYRFTVCTGENLYGSSNLPKILPSLIESYILENDIRVEKINAYLDGRLDSRAKRKMREELGEIRGVEQVVVDNFTKKRKEGGRIIKGYNCPKLVWTADTLANDLYRNSDSMSDLEKMGKMIRTDF